MFDRAACSAIRMAASLRVDAAATIIVGPLRKGAVALLGVAIEDATQHCPVDVERLATAGLSWPLPAEMTDGALETALFAAAGTKQGHRPHAEPDWAEIHRELKRSTSP
jgi:hypothetical protein